MQVDQNNNYMDELRQQFEIYAQKYNISSPRRKKAYESCIDYINYLKKYAKDNNIKKDKIQQTQSTSTITTTYSIKKDNIIQDLSINTKEESRYQGTMTDDEITASRIKLGFINPENHYDTTYRLKKDHIIQDLPINSQEESRYQGVMTAGEIKASQKKIGPYKLIKRK